MPHTHPHSHPHSQPDSRYRPRSRSLCSVRRASIAKNLALAALLVVTTTFSYATPARAYAHPNIDVATSRPPDAATPISSPVSLDLHHGDHRARLIPTTLPPFILAPTTPFPTSISPDDDGDGDNASGDGEGGGGGGGEGEGEEQDEGSAARVTGSRPKPTQGSQHDGPKEEEGEGDGDGDGESDYVHIMVDTVSPPIPPLPPATTFPPTPTGASDSLFPLSPTLTGSSLARPSNPNPATAASATPTTQTAAADQADQGGGQARDIARYSIGVGVALAVVVVGALGVWWGVWFRKARDGEERDRVHRRSAGGNLSGEMEMGGSRYCGDGERGAIVGDTRSRGAQRESDVWGGLGDDGAQVGGSRGRDRDRDSEGKVW